MHGRALADPVDGGDCRGADDLIDADHLMAIVDGHIHRLTDGLGELMANRATQDGQVVLLGCACGQLHDAVAEPVPPPLGVLLHQSACLQGGQQAKYRGLVHGEFPGDLGDADRAVPGQHLQD